MTTDCTLEFFITLIVIFELKSLYLLQGSHCPKYTFI